MSVIHLDFRIVISSGCLLQVNYISNFSKRLSSCTSLPFTASCLFPMLPRIDVCYFSVLNHSIGCGLVLILNTYSLGLHQGDMYLSSYPHYIFGCFSFS